MSPNFEVINRILTKHHETLLQFIEWGEAGKFDEIRRIHADWWMFPINANSNKGTEFRVSPEDVEYLKRNQQFMAAYRLGLEITSWSFGWNLKQKCTNDQMWGWWPIRLRKMCESAVLFGEIEYAQSLLYYAKHLMDKRIALSYLGKRLESVFEKMIQTYLYGKMGTK